MPRFELNPEGGAAEMLAGLNHSFPGWGGSAEYRWYFDRPVGPKADLLILRGRRGVVAATGINYRRIALDADTSVLGGILTSSWTAPEERRRGLFGRLVELSASRIRDRGGALLIAFVTEDNPSCRALSTFGCALFPSWYLFSTSATPRVRTLASCRTVEPTTVAMEKIRGEVSSTRRGYLHFRYEPLEWEFQFLRRPHPVEVLGLEGGASALVETVPSRATAAPTDRVQLLSTPDDPEWALSALLARAQRPDRQLFLFATQTDLVAAARGLGIEVKPGRIAVRSLDGGELPTARRWSLSSGDRM